jgi:hypothetical protein
MITWDGGSATTRTACRGTISSPPSNDLTTATQGVREAAARAWSLSDAELRDAVEAVCRAASRVEAARLAVVKALDERPGAVAGARAGATAAEFLVRRLNVDPGRARADVEAAYALAADSGTLPQVGAALAAGDITREHAAVCVRAAARLPKRLAEVTVTADSDTTNDENTEDGEESDAPRTGLQVADGWLADQARRFGAREVGRLATQLVTVLDPDRTQRTAFDPDAVMRREVTWTRDWTGMGLLRAQVTAADAVLLDTLLAAVAAPEPAREALAVGADGTEQAVLVRDERTLGMRRYDGLMAVLRAGLGRTVDTADTSSDSASDESGTARTARTPDVHVLVTATVEQVAAATAAGTTGQTVAHAAGLAHAARTGPIDADLLAYLTCTPVLRRVLTSPAGAPLDVGRAHRLATPAQRQALAVRDGGCVIPACACPPEDADAHHVIPWSAGGPTDLSNLVLACPAHHQQIHTGLWTVTLDHHGIARAVPPPWIDPRRRPIRNLLNHHHAEAAQLAQQLRLALDPPDDPP